MKNILRIIIKSILWLLDPDHRKSESISNNDDKKFTHIVTQNFQSDFGKTTSAVRTIPYDVWEIRTATKVLMGADKHRIIRSDGSCVWIADLKSHDKIRTNTGIEEVVDVKPLGFKVHMYCLEVETQDISNPYNHLYYTNGILSHNTETAASFLLWFATFNSNTNTLIASNLFKAASEIMDRIKFSYERLPDFLRCGVLTYNVQKIVFDNGSRIESTATTANSGRGKSISLLFCLAKDTNITIRNKKTGKIETISLGDLAIRLSQKNHVDMFFENTDYEILTPSGWQDFRGIQVKSEQKLFKLSLSNGTSIRATADHQFFSNNKKTALKNIIIGQFIDHKDDNVSVVSIDDDDIEEVIDIVEVNDPFHRFYVNDGIVTKNCDELAWVDKRIAEEFWTSITPTLSTGGKCIITSTPNNDEDTFSQIWAAANKTTDEFGNDLPRGIGINGFKAFMAKWQQFPGRDEEWANIMRAKLGAEKFARDYDLEFISADSTLIDSRTLTNMVAKQPLFKTGEVRWWEKPAPGNYYLIALDPAVGNGGNDSAIQIWKLPELVQVGEWMHNRSDSAVQVKMIIQICNYIDREIKKDNPNTDSEIFWTFENNSYGEAIITLLNEIGWDAVPAQLLNEPNQVVTRARKGLNTNGRTKSQAAAKLKSLVESHRIGINSKPLISQLKSYVSIGNTFRGKGTEKDDLVSALLLIIRMSQIIAKWDDQTADAVREKSLLDIDDLESFEPVPPSIMVW